MTRDQVLAQLRSHQKALEGMGVRSLALFGSMAHGEAGPESDIDLLVEFGQPVGLFEFVHVKTRLEQILGREVDLVTPDALRESMRPQIPKEAVRVTPTMDPAH